MKPMSRSFGRIAALALALQLSLPAMAAATAAPFADLPLPLSAVLVDMAVPFATLSRLAVGQVLPVSVARNVPLRVGEQTQIAPVRHVALERLLMLTLEDVHIGAQLQLSPDMTEHFYVSVQGDLDDFLDAFAFDFDANEFV